MNENDAVLEFGRLLGPKGLNLIDHTFILSNEYGIFDTYERASFYEMLEAGCEEYSELTPFYTNFDVDAGFIGAAVLEYPEYFDLYYFKLFNSPSADKYYILCPHGYSIEDIYEDITAMYDDPEDKLEDIELLKKSLYKVDTRANISKKSLFEEDK
jgi:hypothetical protein